MKAIHPYRESRTKRTPSVIAHHYTDQDQEVLGLYRFLARNPNYPHQTFTEEKNMLKQKNNRCCTDLKYLIVKFSLDVVLL